MDAGLHGRDIGVRFLFDRLSRQVSPSVARIRRGVTEKWALRDVDFKIGRGEGVALIGPSGSGKTTLLRVLAGVIEPDEGAIGVSGRIGSLLSVDAGLMPVLTGKENTELLGVLAGLSRAGALEAVPGIEQRVKVGDAFNKPVASYSQGMRARLGFAVAEELEPGILLLDEVHEALDHEFRDFVEERAKALLDAGGIVVAAGHDHPLLHRLCERAILLRDGAVVGDGSFHDVRRAYLGPRDLSEG
ncbi:MAG: ABC transporter ATP-binding protein [Solirubrobacterales bacterium]|nr:ABC transporter ATP-binding protein [Solirubrobacterales bacterium]